MDQAKFLGSDFINDVFKSLTVKVVISKSIMTMHISAAPMVVMNVQSVRRRLCHGRICDQIRRQFYWHDSSGFFAMAGITDGMLNPTVKATAVIDSLTADTNSYNPATTSSRIR